MKTLTAIQVAMGVAVFAVGCSEPWQPEGLGALSSVVTVGREGAWLGSLADNIYRLENSSDPQAIRYFYTAPPAGSPGSRTVSVNVSAEAGPDSRAGLLYGFTGDPLFYYMVTVEPDGSGALYRRDEDGLNLVMSGSAPAAESGFARLEVRESNSGIEAYVNGESIGSLGSRGVGGGSTGIIAVGDGRFEFTNYRTPESAAAQAPTTQEADARGSASGGDILRLKRFDIVDSQGFGSPVVAMSLLAPADWRLEGGVNWNPNFRCFSELVAAQARLVSPDGRFAFEFFPTYATQWMDDAYARDLHAQGLAQGGKGCPLAPPSDSVQFVTRTFTQGFRPGARIVRSEENSEVAREARAKMMAQQAAAIRQSGMQVETDAARARLAYDRDGAAMEEWVLATTFRLATQTFSAGAAMQGRVASSLMHHTFTERIFAFSAPKGRLDENERLLSTMVASIRVHPGWESAVRQGVNQINRIEAEGARATADIVRRSTRRIFDDWNASLDQRANDWRQLQESQDRIAKKWNNALRGTDEFLEPGSNTSWDLTSDYEYVWKTPLDEFVLSNNPNFNPNQELNGSWEQLRRAP